MDVQNSYIVCSITLCCWDMYLSYSWCSSKIHPKLESKIITMSVLDKFRCTIIHWAWNWSSYIYIISCEFIIMSRIWWSTVQINILFLICFNISQNTGFVRWYDLKKTHYKKNKFKSCFTYFVAVMIFFEILESCRDHILLQSQWQHTNAIHWIFLSRHIRKGSSI